ncbi:MAG: flavodoxin family protein [Clostridia bacterium]|nr:flavodoxin family protein [Clostridia bacterium]
MEITVLTGSPVRDGSSNLLAKEFIRGAEEVGHEIRRFDAAHSDIHICSGCVACGYEGPCVQQDGMNAVRESLLGSDMVVFVTPLYYYGMTAQLKTLIDRFCSFNSSLNRRHLRSALIAVAWNADDWTFDALMAHYNTLVRYLNFRDEGTILGYGCGTPAMTMRSTYPKKAFDFGRSLR